MSTIILPSTRYSNSIHLASFLFGQHLASFFIWSTTFSTLSEGKRSNSGTASRGSFGSSPLRGNSGTTDQVVLAHFHMGLEMEALTKALLEFGVTKTAKQTNP